MDVIMVLMLSIILIGLVGYLATWIYLMKKALLERVAYQESENKRLGERLVGSVCKECKCENIIKHNESVGKRKIELDEEVKELKDKIKKLEKDLK